jgi:DNA repair protein RecO (recombination protein O)
MLPLPQCLLGQSSLNFTEISQGLTTTGHFLNRIAAELSDRPMPAARDRFLDRIAKKAAQEAPPF